MTRTVFAGALPLRGEKGLRAGVDDIVHLRAERASSPLEGKRARNAPVRARRARAARTRLALP